MNSVIAVAADYIKNYGLLSIPRKGFFLQPVIAIYWIFINMLLIGGLIKPSLTFKMQLRETSEMRKHFVNLSLAKPRQSSKTILKTVGLPFSHLRCIINET